MERVNSVAHDSGHKTRRFCDHIYTDRLCSAFQDEDNKTCTCMQRLDALDSSTNALREAMAVGDDDKHRKDEMQAEGAAATNQPRNELSTLGVGCMINTAKVVYPQTYQKLNCTSC